MSYVPTPRPELPRVHELSERLVQTIEEYRSRQGASPGEVRQALRIAASRTAPGGMGHALAIVAGLALLAVIVWLGSYLAPARSESADVTWLPAILIGVGVAIVGVAQYVRNR